MVRDLAVDSVPLGGCQFVDLDVLVHGEDDDDDGIPAITRSVPSCSRRVGLFSDGGRVGLSRSL